MCWVVYTYYYGYVTFSHLKPWGYIPYNRQYMRHEIFMKSLKTRLSRLFVHETTPEIHESQHNYNNTMIIGTIINNINWWCMKWCSRFYFHEDKNLQKFYPLIILVTRYASHEYHFPGIQLNVHWCTLGQSNCVNFSIMIIFIKTSRFSIIS